MLFINVWKIGDWFFWNYFLFLFVMWFKFGNNFFFIWNFLFKYNIIGIKWICVELFSLKILRGELFCRNIIGVGKWKREGYLYFLWIVNKNFVIKWVCVILLCLFINIFVCFIFIFFFVYFFDVSKVV